MTKPSRQVALAAAAVLAAAAAAVTAAASTSTAGAVGAPAQILAQPSTETPNKWTPQPPDIHEP